MEGAQIIDKGVVLETFDSGQNNRDPAPSGLEDSLHAALSKVGSILIQIGPIGTLEPTVTGIHTIESEKKVDIRDTKSEC